MLDAEGRRVVEKAREGGQEGKSASTQAGEFVREEMHHAREGSTERARRNRQSQPEFRRRVGLAEAASAEARKF